VTTATVHLPAVDPERVEAADPVAPLLDYVRTNSGGRLLNMHKQMAASPLVLEQYAALRRAIGDHATLDIRVRAALAVAASAAGESSYTLTINSLLAVRAGWTSEQVTAIVDGRSSGHAHLDALLEVAREATTGNGEVPEQTWADAVAAGWSTAELAETFGYLALVAFCDRFVRYARTDFDVVAPR
jgi:hypothetical protein